MGSSIKSITPLFHALEEEALRGRRAVDADARGLRAHAAGPGIGSLGHSSPGSASRATRRLQSATEFALLPPLRISGDV